MGLFHAQVLLKSLISHQTSFQYSVQILQQAIFLNLLFIRFDHPLLLLNHLIGETDSYMCGRVCLVWQLAASQAAFKLLRGVGMQLTAAR